MKVQGIILAGGKSRRFGEDKALMVAHGITFLERAAHLLKELGLESAVITNPSQKYSFLNCPVYRDLIPDKGPLGGLLTAAQIFKGSLLLTLTCDMPALTAMQLRILLERHRPSNKVTLLGSCEHRMQPFPGIYDSNLSALLLKSILEDRLSVQEFLQKIQKVEIIPSEWGDETFCNVNRKDDFNLWMKTLDEKHDKQNKQILVNSP